MNFALQLINLLALVKRIYCRNDTVHYVLGFSTTTPALQCLERLSKKSKFIRNVPISSILEKVCVVNTGLTEPLLIKKLYFPTKLGFSTVSESLEALRSPCSYDDNSTIVIPVPTIGGLAECGDYRIPLRFSQNQTVTLFVKFRFIRVRFCIYFWFSYRIYGQKRVI